MFKRIILTISCLSLWVTNFGCEPVKMYNGPKLDRSELALISGKSHKLADSATTNIFLVDGKAVDEEKGDGSELPGEQEVLIIPGKHKICIAHECHRHYGVSRFNLWLKAVFELTVEAGKRYHVKMQQKPFAELSREEKDRLPFRVPHQLWVEDMDTSEAVPIHRYEAKESVSIPLTQSRDGRAGWTARSRADTVARYYDAGDTKLPLDEVSILFVQHPTYLSSIDGQKSVDNGWPMSKWLFFDDNYIDLTDNIQENEYHLLPGRHEITTSMYLSNMGFNVLGTTRVITRAGPLTKVAVFKKGHVYYIKDCQVEPNKWTFKIIEVGTIHQATPRLITANIAYHWDDCWNNAPNHNSDIVFNPVSLLKGDKKNTLQDSKKTVELNDGYRSKIEDLSGKSKEYVEDDNNKSIFLNPKDANDHFNRGVQYYKKRNIDKAIIDFTKAIDLDPTFVNAHYNRGVAFEKKGDIDKAIADYTKAIELNPKYARAYYNRGVVYGKREDIDKAIEDYTKAIDLNTKYIYAYNNRGRAYEKKGDIDMAIADYSKAIVLDPKYVKAYYNRALAYKGKGDIDKAIADYNKAVDLNPQYADDEEFKKIIEK